MQQIQLTAAHLVQQVLENGRNLNQILEDTLRNKTAWKSSERGALQDLSFGTLRFYGQLRGVLGQLLEKPLEDQRIVFVLLVALYQLQYSKAGQHAVVDQAVQAVRTLNQRMSGLANAVLRNFLRNQEALMIGAERTPEGKFSHAAWWIDMLTAQYGKEVAAQILAVGNQHPPMTLRVNVRHHTVDQYAELLANEGQSGEFVAPDALLLHQPVSVDKLPGFFDGWVSVQDAGAQCAAGLLDVKNGMRVLDACAAPGGKTAHLLELYELDLWAVDKDAKRLHRVDENLQRLHLQAKLVLGDAELPSQWWNGKPFDRILADVPCSASGVVRRHPDIKWLRRREDISAFARQQLDIVQALWTTLAVGGKMLYVTCSVFSQENEGVISAFLAKQKDATRLPLRLPNGSTGQLVPSDLQDGFFYALLQKTS